MMQRPSKSHYWKAWKVSFTHKSETKKLMEGLQSTTCSAKMLFMHMKQSGGTFPLPWSTDSAPFNFQHMKRLWEKMNVCFIYAQFSFIKRNNECWTCKISSQVFQKHRNKMFWIHTEHAVVVCCNNRRLLWFFHYYYYYCNFLQVGRFPGKILGTTTSEN